MSDHLGEEFKDVTLEIDGNTYDQCKFDNCKLVYRGGTIPTFARCNLNRCAWVWADSALRTIGFLRGIYDGMGSGGRQMIDGVINEIRTPFGTRQSQ